MDIRFEHRKAFYVSGYSKETKESSHEKDITALRKKHESSLRSLASELYFVSWLTKNDTLIYHFGIERQKPTTTYEDEICIKIPAAYFAVATVPEGMSVLTAWMDFFEKEIPALGAVIDTDYGIYFEHIDENGVCELWIPIIKPDE